MRTSLLKREQFNKLYRQYNRRRYVNPDPLQFLYRYDDIRDREIAGLIASSLAYGRVAQILRSVDAVLSEMGDSPASFIASATSGSLRKLFTSFKHRFTTGSELISLLTGIKRIIKEYGSLNECFAVGFGKNDGTLIPALTEFSGKLNCEGNYLIPRPENGSACKRLNLYLRWMVRKDSVDPGGWTGISKRLLIVPLDTHMAKIGMGLGLTDRKTPDMKMALDITCSFAALEPNDPVKYDFALTRFGIRHEFEIVDLLKRFD